MALEVEEDWQEVERHEEREGRPKSGLTEAPFGDMWEGELQELAYLSMYQGKKIHRKATN